jgi:phosphoribosylamine--glycine ligase
MARGRILALDAAQDFKYALDGDRGEMTGGMGSYSPVPFLCGEELWEAHESIFPKFLAGCKAEGITFVGTLFPGIKLTTSGAKVLEFNARFGDPETQVLARRLRLDFAHILYTAARGEWNGYGGAGMWSEEHCACVVLASRGYPGAVDDGKPITGIPHAEEIPDVKVFHAGTKRGDDGKLYSSGGRVCGVSATALSLQAACERAYAAADLIKFDGKQLRHDIGKRAIAMYAEL